MPSANRAAYGHRCLIQLRSRNREGRGRCVGVWAYRRAWRLVRLCSRRREALLVEASRFAFETFQSGNRHLEVSTLADTPTRRYAQTRPFRLPALRRPTSSG
jgi:hypothetical protein